MKSLLIENLEDYHYEIIESVIVHYKTLTRQDEDLEIYLVVIKNKSFEDYIKSKYKNIRFKTPTDVDFYINCSIYTSNMENIRKDSDTHFYIAHEVSEKLTPFKNVYFMTPLCKNERYIQATVFPKNDDQASMTQNMPIYIIQGNLTSERRYFNLLVDIFDHTFDFDFRVKFIGRGKLPLILKKYKNRIILKNNLNFMDYHAEFSNGYCIIPLITKQSHPQYYTHKFTSSISYAKGYNLKCLIDRDLQNIYNLEHAEVYDTRHQFVESFGKTLSDFYETRN